MPTKIQTDQPAFKRRTLQTAIGASFETVVEPPYFSVPLTDEDVATVDPSDADRELRAGEVFIATAVQIANSSSVARTVDVEIVGEGGVTTSIAPGLTVPPHEILSLGPGLSLFKRNLDNPGAAGDILRVRADQAGALTLTASVVEREAIDHAPDTEAI